MLTTGLLGASRTTSAAASASSTPGAGVAVSAPVILVAYDPSAWRWWHVDIALFRRVLGLAGLGAAADDPDWIAATGLLCRADLRPAAPVMPGATLASLGNAWGMEDYFRGLRMLRRRVPLRRRSTGRPLPHCLAGRQERRRPATFSSAASSMPAIRMTASPFSPLTVNRRAPCVPVRKWCRG